MTSALWVTATIASSLAAQPAAAPRDVEVVGEKRDPQAVVCEEVRPVGSRLITRRVCATNHHWAEKRLLDRQGLEEVVRRSLQGNAR